MTYSVKVEYSPAYELVMSFYAFVYFKKLKPLSLGKDWYEETKASLPKKTASELEDERWGVLHRMVLLISQSPGKATVPEFLKWLEHVPDGEVFERLSPWVESIPSNIGEIKKKVLFFLNEWHEFYFQHFSKDIVGDLEKKAQIIASLAETTEPIDLIEQVTNGIRVEPTESLKQVYLLPQYHCSPHVIHDYFHGMATYLFSYTAAQQDKTINLDNISSLAHALSDINRLKILQLLAVKKRDLTEIHGHLGIAKSTVHHHLTILSRAGIIRRHYMGNTTISFYSLRPFFIASLTNELNRLVTGG
ncbi:ArsR/SmtB family transcription factor [Peribacillus glennii]|uniref:ArsR family transcriptional regulator n=1 Tax=Peribacillus glennii TaxID=2303991 RepID=A0A372LAS7_9BACI|nr:metalloregulator ArsR/SmtB family transcription factor [Peribacillus glennii]RFU62845.1 ArsR family transcriptional regulator [Peribacillus glennii]